jgi:hypothetical protein
LGTWGTWWEHFENLSEHNWELGELDGNTLRTYQNTIENLGNLMGTPWELDQNTIKNLGNLLGTLWELDGNTVGTDRKQPHLKPLLTVRDHILCSSRERERTWVFEKTWGCWREKRGEHGPWVLMIEWDSEREHGCVPTCYKPWQIERDYGRFFIVGRLVLSVFWGGLGLGDKKKILPQDWVFLSWNLSSEEAAGSHFIKNRPFPSSPL